MIDYSRFELRTPKDNGTAIAGWSGTLVDKATGKRYRLSDIATDGHGASFYCSFDSKDKLIKAARRKARQVTEA